jgi:hypothetical protein
MSSISRLIAAIVREQVGRDGAEAESWRLAALAAREEYSEISDALRQETRLSLALTEQRDAAIAERDALRARFEALRPDPSMLARSAVVADSRDTSCAPNSCIDVIREEPTDAD